MVIATALAAAAVAVVACGGGDSKSDTTRAAAQASAGCKKIDNVRLVLQWVAQSQFAGYYAARDKGLYAKECLNVAIQEGGVNVIPQQVLSSGNADLAISQLPKTLATREEGADIVNISQSFQRGAFLQVSWADSGIKTIADLKGTRVGSWGFGNDAVLLSAMRANGVDPAKDVKIIQQPFDMSLLTKHEVQSAQAKTYNEYAQLLETKNPKTGKLYQPGDLNILDLQKLGFTSYEDGIYAMGPWLRKPGNADIATRFIKASDEGWIYCRDHFEPCVDTVLHNSSTLGKGHMSWMLNEINKLIWPSPKGIGTVDAAAWNSTAKIALEGKIIKRQPDAKAYRTDLNAKALKALKAEGVDVTGAHYVPKNVTITPGGE